MKYLLVIYSSPATWEALSQRQRDDMMTEHSTLCRDLGESGEWVGGNPLAGPSLARGGPGSAPRRSRLRSWCPRRP